MKTFFALLTAVLTLVTAHFASAQSQTVKYLDKTGLKQVPETEAYYSEVIAENADGSGTRTRYLVKDKSKVSVYSYSDIDGGKFKFGIKDGPHYEWHENGKLKTEAVYKDDTLAGEYKTWYESGKLLSRRSYNVGALQDTLTAYYETGKLRRTEVYEGKKLTIGRLYDESGKELDFYPMFKFPEFPGGEHMLMVWLSRNIKYPKEAIKANSQGTVMISFVVDKSGRLRDAEVTRSVHHALDAEALKVIRKMPDWKPGLDEGKPVSVRFTLPVTFAFQD